MQLCFFDVDKDYVKFLQNEEKLKRGFSKVPNMDYEGNHEKKLVCGVVLKINGYNYYVPVSSYKQKQPNNIQIVLDDTYNKIKGTLRFNYMFPIKEEYVSRRNFNNEEKLERKIFLRRQLTYCNSIKDEVYEMAKKTYEAVINNTDEFLVSNSCDFKLLESSCDKYENIINKLNEDVAITSENSMSNQGVLSMKKWNEKIVSMKTQQKETNGNYMKHKEIESSR